MAESPKEEATMETQRKEGAAPEAVAPREGEAVAQTPQKEGAAEKNAAAEKEAASKKAEAEKAGAEKEEAGERSAKIRIAHLSDLHFGFGFNEDLWNDLSRIVVSDQPHIVLVTGDLVNSPFPWTLGRAREKT